MISLYIYLMLLRVLPKLRGGRGTKVTNLMPIGRLIAAATIVVACLVAGTTQSSARTEAPCDTRKLSQPLMSFGDYRDYYLANGGDFERLGLSSVGWTLSSGTGQVEENEPWRVADARHGRAVYVTKGGRISNSGLCLFSNEESIRFFYKSPGITSSMSVQVTLGGKTTTTVISNRAAGWGLSPTIAVPVSSSTNGLYATVTFIGGVDSGRWLIDDLLIDPRRQGCC